MKRILAVFCLILCLFIPQSSAQNTIESDWEIDLENGYISTKPIFVGDQVIVRTSGFWTGEERPHVYSFDTISGVENWRFINPNSTNHDMSPLLHVSQGSGDCGNWSDMVIVGWTDGKVTALNSTDGSLVWEAETEVVTWGITGKMAVDEDNLVVPTRQGLSRYCLSDGEQNLRIDLPQLGWRNGVTVTNDSYLIGNEEGVLNIISKTGDVTNLSIGEGMIRHPPIKTSAGIVIHLQTSQGSEIYLDDFLLSQEGTSPAIPLQVGEQIFFATSDSLFSWRCSINCTFEGRSNFHSNGEITHQNLEDNFSVWFPINTPNGGWGSGIPGQQIMVYSTNHDTYTTAGVAFGSNGEMALGNDAGVLMVISGKEDQTDHGNEGDDNSMKESSFQVKPVHFVVVGLLFGTLYSYSKSNRDLTIKLGVLLALVIAISALPLLSEQWSEEVSKLSETPGDWNKEWPNDWQGTQVVVFELPEGEYAIGGLSGYENVDDLTDAAAGELGIDIEKKSYSLGEMVVSINGQELEGWEFTIDGERTQVGISSAEVEEDSVVRWSAA